MAQAIVVDGLLDEIRSAVRRLSNFELGDLDALRGVPLATLRRELSAASDRRQVDAALNQLHQTRQIELRPAPGHELTQQDLDAEVRVGELRMHRAFPAR